MYVDPDLPSVIHIDALLPESPLSYSLDLERVLAVDISVKPSKKHNLALLPYPGPFTSPACHPVCMKHAAPNYAYTVYFGSASLIEAMNYHTHHA